MEDRRLLSAYLGTPFLVGQKIEAEQFDLGGEGVGYHDTTTANLGGALRTTEAVDIEATADAGAGFAVASTAPGEWLAYTVTVPTAGNYFIETRVASPKSGGSLHYEWEGRNVSGGIPIPNTGSFQTYWTLKTGPIALTAGTHTLRLVLNSVGAASLGSFNWLRLTPYSTTTGGGGSTGGGGATVTNGLKATYFDNMDLTGKTVSRTDSNINFNWDNHSPVPLIAPDTFSVRWTGKVKAQKTERYTFYARSDDGVRVWVNNQLLISCWTPHPAAEFAGSINLVAGQKYDIKVEYFQRYGGAQISLSWSSPATAKQIIPSSQLFTS
ncbi:MAG TPA: PA14 domain-containing protein [Tepidisphaeraceae bacterium]|nr:PA14 domain-containing protein [Tepidisphaeraceae bacterium]